mmetsp:Transcript_12812/g.25501  ORF Transcript_12812/g.25501 Transcript_12812/m.25501 type:complete len:237 (+) Transcript_12812:709-1419(+)
MSRQTAMTPITLPLRSRRVVAFSSISTRFFSLVKRGNSKLAASRPFRAPSNILFRDARCSSVMKSCTRFRPSTSWLENPVISAAFLFHSLTVPLASMPNMTAFAQSINASSSWATRVCSSITIFVSVMSSPDPMTPTILPSTSRRGVTFKIISTWSKSLVKTGNSKFLASCPFRAPSITFLTDARYSSVTNFSTKFCPSASSLENPVIAAALWFHSFTIPAISTPHMGALTVYMKF